MKTAESATDVTGVPPVRSNALLGTIDERVTFLREGKTEILLALLGEISTPLDIGCSRNFFLLAIDSRFRKTQPEELFDLIAAVLRERVLTKS